MTYKMEICVMIQIYLRSIPTEWQPLKKRKKAIKKERRRKLVIDFYRCCAKKINVEKVEKETRPEPSKIIFELVPSTESRALSGKT